MIIHNANEDAENGRIKNGAVGEWDSLFVPNSIKVIESGAYKGCINIKEIEFEDGGESPLALYEEAFADCTGLQRVKLPARVETIQDRCFSGCAQLEEFEIEQGARPLGVGFCVFADCPNDEKMKAVMVEEQQNRRERMTSGSRTENSWKMPFLEDAGRTRRYNGIMGAKGVRHSKAELQEKFKSILTVAKGLPSVGSDESYYCKYYASYKKACERSAAIDWAEATDAQLEWMLHDPGRDWNHVASIYFGTYEMQGVAWSAEHFSEYRLICSEMKGLLDTRDSARKVGELRERFRELLNHNLNVVFNRAVAALNPKTVVQILDQERLKQLLFWLYAYGFMDRRDFVVDSWFEESAAVRKCLIEFLPDEDEYSLGVFAWILVEAFIAPTTELIKLHQPIIREALKELGLWG